MKLTLAMNNEKFTIETESDEHNIYNMAEYLKRILISAGYHPDCVKEIFSEE